MILYIYTPMHTHTLSSLKKIKGDPAICKSMDETEGCYIKQNKPDKEK